MKERRKRLISLRDEYRNEPWLMSYADLMTLLLVFFIMMFVLTSADSKDVEKLRKHLATSLGGQYESPYSKLSDQISEQLSDLNLKDDVKVVYTIEGIEVLSKGTLFFDSAQTDLKPQAKEVLLKVSDLISQQKDNFKIIVEGHTDDLPIKTKAIASNWELSSLRASAVVRLMESQGISRRLLRPVGMADLEPLVPNRDSNNKSLAKNQAKNRRIVLRIQKELAY